MKSIVIFLIFINFLNAQEQQYCLNFPSFKLHIETIFDGTSSVFVEYPKPPKLSDVVLFEMEKEAMSDSLMIYLNDLSVINYKGSTNQEKAIEYINQNGHEYSLLALTAHWNPDLRLKALIQINKNLKIKPLVNSKKMKNGEWDKLDKISLSFLINLLECNPLFFNGSENATIHSLYISNILWSLDLLTKEEIVKNQQLRDWYSNELQFKNAVVKWKSHIK